jgi:1-pyrroline-5-carboxylate dehydrogenase
VFSDKKVSMHPPHERNHLLGHFSKGDASHVQAAIDAAMSAKEAWENTSWEHRASVFMKAAELLAGPYRAKLNAATMLAQSKNAYQAEIDAACELIDFFRYNVQYMTEIYKEQPDSGPGIWNRLEHRALEGFIFALTPFNFTSICANLCAAALSLCDSVCSTRREHTLRLLHSHCAPRTRHANSAKFHRAAPHTRQNGHINDAHLDRLHGLFSLHKLHVDLAPEPR